MHHLDESTKESFTDGWFKLNRYTVKTEPNVRIRTDRAIGANRGKCSSHRLLSQGSITINIYSLLRAYFQEVIEFSTDSCHVMRLN